MAQRLRVRRAAGAPAGPIPLRGIFNGIPRRPGDHYFKTKQPVSIPVVVEESVLGATGLTTQEVPGYVDLLATMDVQRMGSLDAGSIILLAASGDISYVVGETDSGTISAAALRLALGYDQTVSKLEYDTSADVASLDYDFDDATVEYDQTVAGLEYDTSADVASLDYDFDDATVEYDQTVAKLAYSGLVGGPFQVAETITGGTSGATATIDADAGGVLSLSSIVGGPFQVAETITGGTSGATADVDTYPVPFQVAETVTGGTSGATGTVAADDGTYLMLTGIVGGPFQAGETITGGVTGAIAGVATAEVPFTLGETVTGGTSGATGTIDADAGGVLHLSSIVGGPFQAAETILGGTSGAIADVNAFPVAFSVAETITGGTSGATATIDADAAGILSLSTIVGGPFTVGETITGGTSGATADVDTYPVPFQVAETVTGGTSGATGTVAADDGTNLQLTGIAGGPFQAAETITGGTSGATAGVVTAEVPFQVAETVTGGTSGATATVDVDAGGVLHLSSIVGGPFQAAETIVGGTSGASADVNAFPVAFSVAETVTGGTSGATGTIDADAASILSLSAVAGGPFTVGETVTGGTSGATAEVSTYPIPLQLAETVTGGTSGATGVVHVDDGSTVRLNTIAGGPFTVGETITGGTSGAIFEVTTLADFIGVDGTILESLDPAETSIYVTLPAQHLGTTAGATKNTSAAGANVLTVNVEGGFDLNIQVTASATLANAVLLRELMQGFETNGLDLFVDLGGVGSDQVRIVSPLGTEFEIVASGLATVLGFTAATYTPTVRGNVTQDDIDVISATTLEVLDSNPEYPSGAAVDDFAFVLSNGGLAERTVTYDAVDFTVNFAIVT